MINDNDLRDLSPTELKRVLSICKQLHEVDLGTSFVSHCQTTLYKAFGDVHFSVEVYQLDRFQMMDQQLDTRNTASWIALAKEHLQNHPQAKRMFSMSTPEPGKSKLEPTLKKFHESALLIAFNGNAGDRSQIWTGLRMGNELLSCLYSREREFTDKQLSLMCTIQSHMETAWQNWKRTRGLKQELGALKEAVLQSEEEEAEAARLRHAVDLLTDRQRLVVECVVAGMDNQQIADDLKISVLTVKKHLQMVFRAMDVQHRMELVAKWHQAHSISLY